MRLSISLNGRPAMAASYEVEPGIPVQLPVCDVHTIGAGGGSIAWVDAGGRLRVGPQSAGADPGPACHGRGGAVPTITDANVVLGRIDPDYFLGGEMRLDSSLSEAALDRVAKQTGLDRIQTALGIIRIANANMVEAIKLMSVKRGHDLRTFQLIAFGGAGPLHAAAMAGELGVQSVIVPLHPGTVSALGLLTVDVRHDYARTVMLPAEASSVELLALRFAEMESPSAVTSPDRWFRPCRHNDRVLNRPPLLRTES